MDLAVIGKKDIEEGINMVGAHADSPRLISKAKPFIPKKMK